MHKIAILLLAFYPYAISLPTPEVERGQAYTATINAPEDSAVTVTAPSWVTVGMPYYIGGDTWKAPLTVAPDAPDAYGRVRLLIAGVEVYSAGVRVGTPGDGRVWLPVALRSP